MNGTKLNGWYFFTQKCDYFFVTNQARRSVKMMMKIARYLYDLNLFNCKTNGATIEDLADYLESRIYLATYESKMSEKWGLCHCINYVYLEGSAGDFEVNKHCEIVTL